MSRPDVIVIGGGIHGCSAAFHLAGRGVKVHLFEKDTLGRHASGVNAGGVRQIFRALPEVPLSVASMAMWEHIEEELEDDCGFHSNGHVFVAENESELARLATRRDELVASGFTHEELIDKSTLRELLPAVADHCTGGLFSKRDGAAMPLRTVYAFRRQMLKLGVGIEEGAAVRSLRQKGNLWTVTLADGRGFEAPAVVNAAGAWAAEFARQAGDHVDMQAVAPMLMISGRLPPFVEPVVSATDAPLSFKQFANGTVLVGGGYEGKADPMTNRTELNFPRLAMNLRTVCSLFPIMRPARIIRAWAGIEGRTRDSLPVIGPGGKAEGLFHTFGFSAHGFQLGPIVGTIVADLITRGATELPIDSFTIDRFGPSAHSGVHSAFTSGI